MGWLYMTSLNGHKTPKAYLDAQFTHTSGASKNRVLKSALNGMRVYYAAVEHESLVTGAKSVFAAVCLVRYNLRDKEGYIFGYKDMDESMGPCESECPASILALLTPTDSGYANEWRKCCQAWLTRPKPKFGDTLKFEEPVRFSDGAWRDTFTLVKPWANHRDIALQAPNGMLVSFRGWRKRNFKIVGD
jgi:hypothetical protein